MSPIHVLSSIFRPRRSASRPLLTPNASSSFSSLSVSSSFRSSPSLRISPLRRRPSALLYLTQLLTFAALLTLFLPNWFDAAHKSAFTPVTVTGQSDHASHHQLPADAAAPASLTLFHNSAQHPVAVVALRLLRARNLTTLLDFPCARQRHITPFLLRLQATEHPGFRYICADPDSSQLAVSHAIIRDAAPDFVGARYTRLAKLSRMPTADLLLHWRNAAERDVVRLRETILAARAAGIQVAIVGARPMPGASWTPELEQISDRFVRNMRAGVYGHAPFPFANAVMAISGAYSEERALVVYDLTVLPDVSVRGVSKEDEKRDGTQRDSGREN